MSTAKKGEYENLAVPRGKRWKRVPGGWGVDTAKKQEILDSSRNLHTKQRTGSTRKKKSTEKKQEIRESSRNPHIKQRTRLTRKRKVRKKSKKKEIYPYVAPQSKTSIAERTEKKEGQACTWRLGSEYGKKQEIRELAWEYG
ncbi:hypothetical protein [Eubacterium xylanophilum]|uniref:hypothetical protein n=1 Tax=Eubacterium xylanophilum TaxID=39497 RepID=UPI00047C8F79|nr:hypothetical protein [Eubacterium xylanophilum]